MSPSKNHSPILTILTPTWNRQRLLLRLYKSILEQRVPTGSFEWLVVDDGSTDGTSEWLATLVDTAPFPIRVIQQKNGGKHRALNRAAGQLRSPWVLVVDSDDWLVGEGLLAALQDIKEYDTPDTLAIIAPIDFGPKTRREGCIKKTGLNYATWNQRYRYSDCSMIMRSAVLRDFKLPEFDNEKFVAESSSFAVAYRDGGICLSPNLIVRGEYQPGGLSDKSLVLRCKNPLGALSAYKAMIAAGLSGRQSLRAKINYSRFYWHAKMGKKYPEQHNFKANRMFAPIGFVLYLRDCATFSGLKSDE